MAPASRERNEKGDKYMVAVTHSRSPNRRCLGLILTFVALVAIAVLLATLFPIYVKGRREDKSNHVKTSSFLMEAKPSAKATSPDLIQQGQTSSLAKLASLTTTTSGMSGAPITPSSMSDTNTASSEALSVTANHVLDTVKTRLTLATKTKPSVTAASTDFQQGQTPSPPEKTSFITTTIASSVIDASVVSSMSAISSASSINFIANLVTNTALQMSVKAVVAKTTQLEGTSTAKIQQLQQTITQITEEVAVTKSCACSSPGTKAHTPIKPVASQSIALDEPGKGTSQDPYKIASIQDLQKLRGIWKNNRGKYFIVIQNIDLSPIANFSPLPGFEGILDGNNKTILNLKIDVTHLSSQRNTGLFETIEGTGQVKNLGLENVLVMGEQNVGGLAGHHSGRIDNSYVTGQVLGTKKYNYVGGLVGVSDTGSRITDSYATAKVSGPYDVGGLVGYLYKGTIQSCYATGTVSGVGNATNRADRIGGLVGSSSDSGISDSHATGKVSGYYYVGGLVGDLYKGTIQSCYATGTVLGIGNTSSTANQIGGLVGGHYGTILSSYATGDVSGRYYIGGLVGLSGSGHQTLHVHINNSYATGNVSGTGITGGLVGDNRGIITKCYAIGQVSGRDRLGGLVGWNTGYIDNTYATGKISGTDSSVGGLVGRSGSDSRINDSYATGKVSGHYYVGGLVGKLYEGTIQRCYGKQQFGTTNTLGAKTDTELKTPSTFTGWDTHLWKLTQNQYPKLKIFLN